jgi:DNA-binding transcriptional LysR family regulator
MLRENVTDLLAFIAVAREGSFTRASAKLGVTQSALSHTLRALEARMGVRLLSRTTRSVAPTAAGERLLRTIAPRFEEIESELAAIVETRNKPAGTIRITATDYAADTVLLPRLSKVLPDYPDLKVELVVDYGLTDIVADRFDIGVRWGDQVAKDMIAVRVGPDARLAVVGSPAYLERHPAPKQPKDLIEHNCINLRLPTRGGLYAWELRKGKRQMQVRVDGQLTFNGTYQMLNAALGGMGLAFIPEELARPHVEAGRLRWVLEDWYPTFPGLHIFYASRREYSKALSVVVEALRDGA